MRKIIIELQVEWDGYEDVADELIVEDAIGAKVEGVGWRLLQQAPCSTLREDLELLLREEQEKELKGEYRNTLRDFSTRDALLTVISLIKDRPPVA